LEKTVKGIGNDILMDVFGSFLDVISRTLMVNHNLGWVLLLPIGRKCFVNSVVIRGRVSSSSSLPAERSISVMLVSMRVLAMISVQMVKERNYAPDYQKSGPRPCPCLLEALQVVTPRDRVPLEVYPSDGYQ